MKDQFQDFKPYIPAEGEEYMNEAQQEHFRKILEGWRSELMRESEKTVNNMQDEALNLPDPNDRATQEEGFSLELRTRDRERKLLAKIEKTLRRLGLDDYGYCDTCGIEIGIKRLEARPTAELCIDCKEVEEQKEKSRAG
ncbi:RNA polymerase-binding protein DksA [Ignatzschineria sp. RMDPL8A]|uniref:RNA polymerase-binding protein DksA n=1 Tax=Ignatzschineria sp. RMDPL8A TaxID=2999236 RepID=UPI0016B9DD54|nr:RNA polymerase-binding protein DksA [Ignatzschineria sp. RMDPL8A]MDG9728834.1 RNA polymerase-binding protein DksA [Ignatzschineria sp. RMDPL8A]NLD08236.1 RNA polymerase-binding protein DksA [Xanthomonadaceae bacterium]